MVKINKEYIEKEYNQAIKEYNAALTEDDLDTALYSLIACSYSFSMYSLSIWVIFFSFLALFSTILEFLFDDKFDTGYFSSRLNWLKFNIYIGQFIDFCLCFF